MADDEILASVEEDVIAELEALTPAAAPVIEPPLDDADKAAADGKKRYSDAIWHEIEVHWEYGTMNGTEIMEKYGMSHSTLRAHLARRGITQFSKRYLLKKAAEVKIVGAAVAAEDPEGVAYEQKRKHRIVTTREVFINQSTALLAEWNKLEKRIVSGERTHAESANDFKGIRHEILGARAIMDGRLICLNADADVDEASMPTLIFRDLSQQEIDVMANADETDDLSLDLPEAPLDLIDEEVVEEGTEKAKEKADK